MRRQVQEVVLKDLACIRKNEATQLRIYLSEFRSRVYLVLREFYLSEDGTWRPSHRGINLDEKFHPEVLAALRSLDAAGAAAPLRPRKAASK